MMHLSTCKGGSACCCPDEHEHVWEFGSYVCVTCGELNQMTFDEVVEYELQPGDPEYTLWLARGKPIMDTERLNVYARTGKHRIDTLPGL